MFDDHSKDFVSRWSDHSVTGLRWRMKALEGLSGLAMVGNPYPGLIPSAMGMFTR